MKKVAMDFKAQNLPLQDFVAEMHKLNREVTYWIKTAIVKETNIVKETKGPVKKFLLKIKHKMLS